MSGGFRWCFINVATILDWQSPYRETDLFPQIKVLDSAGAVDATVNLSANATLAYVYEGSWMAEAEGEYRAYCTIYPTAADRTANTNAREDLSSTSETIRVRKLPTELRPTFGGAGGADIKDIKKAIKDVIVDFWKIKLGNNKTAEDTLITRSDFNAKDDIVKTDVVIPEFPLKDLKNFITGEISDSVADNNKFVSVFVKNKLEPQTKMFNQILKTLKLLDELPNKIDNYKTNLERLEISANNNNQLTDDLGAKINGIFVNLDKLTFLSSQINNILAGVSQMNSNVKNLDLSKITKALKNELDNLNALIQLIYQEMGVSHKMMNGIDKNGKERIKILLSAMQKMARDLSNNISHTNMANVYSGFKILDNQLKELGDYE